MIAKTFWSNVPAWVRLLSSASITMSKCHSVKRHQNVYVFTNTNTLTVNSLLELSEGIKFKNSLRMHISVIFMVFFCIYHKFFLFLLHTFNQKNYLTSTATEGFSVSPTHSWLFNHDDWLIVTRLQVKISSQVSQMATLPILRFSENPTWKSSLKGY